MSRQGLALLVFAALAGFGTLVYAQSGQPNHDSADHAHSLGDGLRHHAEGRLEQAVEHLFRAYAESPRPKTLALIVDSYDQMGFCDAAIRQLDVFERDHSGQQSPTLDRCASTGALSIACGQSQVTQSQVTVSVDGLFETRCGQTIRLPVGEHRLSGALIETARTARIAAGEAERIELTLRPRVSRLSRVGSSIETGSEGSPRVDRLRGPAGDYPSYQARDGLYHIFILPNSAGETMFLPLGLRPEVLRLCDSGERFDRDSRRCLQADGLQIKKME